MDTIFSRAWVLKRYSYGDTGVLATCLTEKKGLVRISSRSLEKKEKFGSRLEPLSFIDIYFFDDDTRDVGIYLDSELIWRLNVQKEKDECLLMLLSVMSEICLIFLPDKLPDLHIFSTFETLIPLSKEGSPFNYLVILLKMITDIYGAIPSFKCVQCAHTLYPLYVSLRSGELICSSCKLKKEDVLSYERSFQDYLEQEGMKGINKDDYIKMIILLVSAVQGTAKRPLKSLKGLISLIEEECLH